MKTKLFNKKTGNLAFFSQNWFANGPNTRQFFHIFFYSSKFFFLVLIKRSKDTKFRHVFEKRLRATLKKYLDNRSKRFANTTQTFFDKRGFQKLEKNLKKFICIQINWQINFGKKKLRYRFFRWPFFLLIC